MTIPEAPRDSRVPDTVTAGPFDRILVLPMRNPVGFAVNFWPATEKTQDVGFDGKGTVCAPITILDDPRDTGLPDIVIIAPRVMKVLATDTPVGLVVIYSTESAGTEGNFKVLDPTIILE